MSFALQAMYAELAVERKLDFISIFPLPADGIMLWLFRRAYFLLSSVDADSCAFCPRWDEQFQCKALFLLRFHLERGSG